MTANQHYPSAGTFFMGGIPERALIVKVSPWLGTGSIYIDNFSFLRYYIYAGFCVSTKDIDSLSFYKIITYDFPITM